MPEGPVTRVPKESLRFEERRSKILSGSDLSCLRDVATINVTRGCAHRCLYCYAQGYSNYPGDGRVFLYRDLPQKLEAELAGKRKKPVRVYFSPSCDTFQPLDAVQDVTYEVMRILLARKISVAFLTKGAVRERFLDLFAEHPGLVHAQIGMTTFGADISRSLELGAASPEDRLSNVRSLLGIGVPVMVRLDPLIPYLTDTSENLIPLFENVAKAGAKSVAVNYLFLRRSLMKKIFSGIESLGVSAATLMRLYQQGPNMPMYRDRSLIRVLPAEFRKTSYARITALAEQAGLAVHLCSCKNSDITGSRCNIAGPPPTLSPDLFSKHA